MQTKSEARGALLGSAFCWLMLSGCSESAAQTSLPTIDISTGIVNIDTKVAPSTSSAGAPDTADVPESSGVPNPATLVTNADGGSACLPFTMPSQGALLDSHKKVFAHYFYPYPYSLDNAPPGDDYYNRNYLSKYGESSKWSYQGGLLRQRPLGVGPSASSQWRVMNSEGAIRAAIARGITGFTYDAMSVTDATSGSGNLQQLLQAAQAVDSRFKIVVMPDLTALGNDAGAVLAIIEAVANSPAAYKLSDGRLVVSAFDASLNSPAWWSSIFSRLSAKGIHVAFVPTFLSWRANADNFASISYGFGDWGTATGGASSSMIGDPDIVHSEYKKIFMMPVDPQQFRPKSFTYWEAGNSASLRGGWMSSIHGGADWVQIVTWNDFSESSQISPYTDKTLNRTIGTGYYDLSAYFSSWFLTGIKPTITHDVLYYFYRREPTNASAHGQGQYDHLVYGTPEDTIEVVAFLTSPGLLKVTIGGKLYTHDAPAGPSTFNAPLGAGVPLFALDRGGAEVFSFQGGVQIDSHNGTQSGVEDLTYWSGSASKAGICTL